MRYTEVMSVELEQSPTAILARAINPMEPTWSTAASRTILDIKLPEADVARRDELAEKASEGTLTPEETAELENYKHAGRILELMKAKARVSLKKAELAS